MSLQQTCGVSSNTKNEECCLVCGTEFSKGLGLSFAREGPPLWGKGLTLCARCANFHRNFAWSELPPVRPKKPFDREVQQIPPNGAAPNQIFASHTARSNEASNNNNNNANNNDNNNNNKAQSHDGRTGYINEANLQQAASRGHQAKKHAEIISHHNEQYKQSHGSHFQGSVAQIYNTSHKQYHGGIPHAYLNGHHNADQINHLTHYADSLHYAPMPYSYMHNSYHPSIQNGSIYNQSPFSKRYVPVLYQNAPVILSQSAQRKPVVWMHGVPYAQPSEQQNYPQPASEQAQSKLLHQTKQTTTNVEPSKPANNNRQIQINAQHVASSHSRGENKSIISQQQNYDDSNKDRVGTATQQREPSSSQKNSTQKTKERKNNKKGSHESHRTSCRPRPAKKTSNTDGKPVKRRKKTKRRPVKKGGGLSIVMSSTKRRRRKKSNAQTVLSDPSPNEGNSPLKFADFEPMTKKWSRSTKYRAKGDMAGQMLAAMAEKKTQNISFRVLSKKYGIAVSTLHRYWINMQQAEA